jgi:hypothetical protein
MPKFPKPWSRGGRGWYVTLNGKQLPLGKQKARAFERYHELMRQPCEQRIVAPESVSGLVDQFLDWVHKNRARDTYLWYRFRLQLFAQLYPDLLVAELKPFHVQQWIDSHPDLSSGSKRNHARSIQRCLSWCEEQGLIDKNPIRHFKKPRGGKRDMVISPEEYGTILAAIRNRRFRDLVTFAWETGARAAECPPGRPTVSSSDGWAFTSPVGLFRPNNSGLYDMSGNAEEWCSDSSSTSHRLLRGVSWAVHAWNCQSWRRFSMPTDHRSAARGFRVAAVPSGK